MKKYFILIAFCTIFAILISQIPYISNEFAKECYAVSVVNSTANRSVFCKGIVEQEYDAFVVKAQISEEDICKVKIGQTAQITCKALGETDLIGRVKELSDFAYKTTYGGVNVTVIDAIIEFYENYEGLKSGYSVSAEIIYNQIKNAAILPFEGIAREDDGQYYVYRIDDKWAVKEYVEIAFENEKGAVISGECDFKKVCEEPERFSGDFVRIKNVGDN